ncbi:ABC transporter permease [Actinomycetospora sp. TBRC 11914]|uniref:ABC transporter permease n=1 Tax=Actinomycetospora sp. TBRC 11914 TaxID=2729387 RepID=UPI00289CE0BE|nr:ABC transporter permease [Actinomycetospora sp. TBRC 11914]
MSAPPVATDHPTPTAPVLRDLPLRAARVRRGIPRPVRRTLVVVALLVVWQVLAEVGVLTPDTLSSPIDTVRTAVDMFASGDLDTALLTSLQRAATGLALGVPVGLVLALASGLFRVGEDVIDSPMQMLRTLPFLGITPLLILWFGIGDTPKIALVFLGVCFPVYVNTLVGIRNVDARLVEAARTFGAGRWSVIRSVVLPGALPNILVGLRLALGIAWLALVVGEQISSDGGIGSLMLQAQDNLRTDRIVVCLVVYALLGLLSDLVVRVLERVLLTWRQGLEAS